MDSVSLSNRASPGAPGHSHGLPSPGYKRRPSADERESTAETEVQMVASQETDV